MANTRGMIEAGGLIAALGVAGIATAALVPMSLASASVASVGLILIAGLVGGTTLRRRGGHRGDVTNADQGTTSAYSYPSGCEG